MSLQEALEISMFETSQTEECTFTPITNRRRNATLPTREERWTDWEQKRHLKLQQLKIQHSYPFTPKINNNLPQKKALISEVNNSIGQRLYIDAIEKRKQYEISQSILKKEENQRREIHTTRKTSELAYKYWCKRISNHFQQQQQKEEEVWIPLQICVDYFKQQLGLNWTREQIEILSSRCGDNKEQIQLSKLLNVIKFVILGQQVEEEENNEFLVMFPLFSTPSLREKEDNSDNVSSPLTINLEEFLQKIGQETKQIAFQRARTLYENDQELLLNTCTFQPRREKVNISGGEKEKGKIHFDSRPVHIRLYSEANKRTIEEEKRLLKKVQEYTDKMNKECTFSPMTKHSRPTSNNKHVSNFASHIQRQKLAREKSESQKIALENLGLPKLFAQDLEIETLISNDQTIVLKAKRGDNIQKTCMDFKERYFLDDTQYNCLFTALRQALNVGVVEDDGERYFDKETNTWYVV